MEKYQDILNQIESLEKQLENPSLTSLQKQSLEVKMNDLIDQAKRMTFHISMCEEDNYVD